MKQKVIHVLEKHLNGLLGAEELSLLLETPSDNNLGDFALPCFTLAKKLRKNPTAIAQELVDKIADKSIIFKAQAVSGYLNLFINRKWLSQYVLEIAFQKDYGKADVYKTFVIEFCSPNTNKGIGDMEIQTLDDLTVNATPEGEVESLTTVRQWDQDASYLRMKNQIGTNWMQLADSDIVYLRGHEYWIAPLTFDVETITTSFINQHLIYTHTEGMVVLDAYSGDIVEGDNLIALLNRSSDVNKYLNRIRIFFFYFVDLAQLFL